MIDFRKTNNPELQALFHSSYFPDAVSEFASLRKEFRQLREMLIAQTPIAPLDSKLDKQQLTAVAEASGWFTPQVGYVLSPYIGGTNLYYLLHDFAKQLIEQEREACARLAEQEPRVWDTGAPDPQHRIANAIRARSKQ